MTDTSLMGRTSRRLAIAVLCLAPLAVLPAGCKLFRRAPMQSTVNTRDPHAAGQLLDGFYGVEAAAWRWTAKQFTVKLKVPAGAAQKGGTLRFLFNITPVVTERSGAITLSAKAAGLELPSETYSAPGAYTYQRDIPASELGKPDVTVVFSLDKSMVPGGPDLRELGVVATTISLDSK
jgi:hypothetical protein